ncbi:hypothetical protein Tco_0983755, partial [Tanacetum coccineum]
AGALENFIKQSQIEIIELQHTDPWDYFDSQQVNVTNHLSNLEIVYDFGAKMVETLEKDKVQSGNAIAIDKGALGDVFVRGTNLGNAHGMAAMVVVFIYQSALLIGLYICSTASKWNLWSSVPKLALKESTPKGHTEDTIMLYFTCLVVVSSVNDDNEIVDTTPLEFLAYELVMVIFM